jgi:hypothetical protein
MLRAANYTRWLSQILFSTYFALLVVTEEETCKPGSTFLHWLAYPLNDYLNPILVNHRVHLLVSRSVALWWLLAVIIFICVRLLARIAFTRALLRYAAGIVAVAGFPLLLLPPCNATGPFLSATTWSWLYFEVVVVVVCVFLYLFGKWPTIAAPGILLLFVHFAVWGWITWQRIGNPFWAIYILLGFCSSVFWGLDAGKTGQASIPSTEVG